MSLEGSTERSESNRGRSLRIAKATLYDLAGSQYHVYKGTGFQPDLCSGWLLSGDFVPGYYRFAQYSLPGSPTLNVIDPEL